MFFYRCLLFTAVIVLWNCPASGLQAQDGFWLRKGTSTGSPKRSIRRTVIKPQKKTPTAKKSNTRESTEKKTPNLSVDPNSNTGDGRKNADGIDGQIDPKTNPPTASGAAESTAETPESLSTTKPASPSLSAANEPDSAKTSYTGVTFSDPVQQKWRVGVVLVTGRDAVADVFTYIPIPKTWPEQSVRIFDEDIPVEFAVQKIDELDGLDRLILRGRTIPAKRKIVALQTFMVTTQRVNPPADTTIFVAPDPKEKLVKKFIGSSAEISFRNNALRKQAQSLFQSGGTPWQQVERIYDWVRDNIDQGDEDPYGTLNTFAKKSGHPEDVVGLFVAMCRANKIPARMVFVDGTQYAEFMLADPAGELHWFPADVVGIRAFGKIVEPKVILQKGDNIRVPGVKAKKKFVAAYGEVKSSTAPKLMQFVREPLSE